MVQCIVIGCTNRTDPRPGSNQDKNISFHRIPAVHDREGKEDYEIRKRRRDGYLAAITGMISTFTLYISTEFVRSISCLVSLLVITTTQQTQAGYQLCTLDTKAVKVRLLREQLLRDMKEYEKETKGEL